MLNERNPSSRRMVLNYRYTWCSHMRPHVYTVLSPIVRARGPIIRVLRTRTNSYNTGAPRSPSPSPPHIIPVMILISGRNYNDFDNNNKVGT